MTFTSMKNIAFNKLQFEDIFAHVVKIRILS